MRLFAPLAASFMLLSCAPRAVVVAPPPRTGSARAAWSDRPDGPLVAALALVGDDGPPLALVDEPLTKLLREQLGRMTADERARLTAGDATTVRAHALLAMLSGSNTDETLRLLACESRTATDVSPALATLDRDLYELPTRIERAAAARYAHVLVDHAKVGLLSGADAAAARCIGLERRDPHLAALASAYRVSVEPLPSNAVDAAWDAAVDLDPRRGATFAATAEIGGVTGEPLEGASEALRVSAALDALGGGAAPPAKALEAAMLALRLDRLDLLPGLLARSPLRPEESLRAAVAATYNVLGPRACFLAGHLRAERICSTSLTKDPAFRAARAAIDVAYGARRDIDPYAITAYASIVVTYSEAAERSVRAAIVGNGTATEDVGSMTVQGGVLRLLADPAAPEDQRTAYGLLADFFVGKFDLSGPNDTPDGDRLFAAATDLVTRFPNSKVARNAAAGLSMPFLSKRDLGPIVSRMPRGDAIPIDLAAYEALAALQERSIREAAIARLADPPLDKSDIERWRSKMLAFELRLGDHDEPEEARSFFVLLAENPPAGDNFEDTLRRAVDAISTLVRIGQDVEARTQYTKISRELEAFPIKPDDRIYVRAFEELGDAMRLRNPALVEGILAKGPPAPIADDGNVGLSLRYHRALVVDAAAAGYLEACAASDRGCRTKAAAFVAAATKELTAARALVTDAVAERVHRGSLASTGTLRVTFPFAPLVGMLPGLQISACALALPPPPPRPDATTKPKK